MTITRFRSLKSKTKTKYNKSSLEVKIRGYAGSLLILHLTAWFVVQRFSRL